MLGRWFERFSRRAWRYVWCLTSQCVLWQPVICGWPNLENFPWNCVCVSKANFEFSTTACPLTILLVSRSSSLTFSSPCWTRADTLQKLTIVWKASWGPSISSWGQPNTIKNHTWWYQRGFSCFLLGTKVNYLHLKDFLKYEREL